MITRYGRKFFLAAATLATGTGLLAGGLLAGAEYVALVTLSVGAYIAGNVAQDWAPARTA